MDAEPEASVSEVAGEVPDASNINIVIRSGYNEVIYYYYISRSLHTGARSRWSPSVIQRLVA